MSDITVSVSTQHIIVDAASSTVSVINAGPQGPAGSSGGVVVSDLNTWTGQQWFHTTEKAIVAIGPVDAAGVGGETYKVGIAAKPINGVNGTRGDSIISDEALNIGASFSAQLYSNFTGTGAHDGPGGAHGVVVFGEMGPNAAYGEACTIAGQMVNNRDGGLAEGAEFTVIDSTGGGRSNGIVIITRAMAAVTRWFRGLWITSQGSHPSGDALYIDGASGWANYIVAKDTAGNTVFKVSNNGAVNTPMLLRANDPARFIAWLDFSPEGIITASPGAIVINTNGGSGVSTYVKESGTGTTGWVASGSSGMLGLYRQGDPARFVTWFPGSPEGVIPASPGAVIFNINGGAGTTMYVKESGTGSTGWVGK